MADKDTGASGIEFKDSRAPRTPRAQEEREVTTRPQTWKPPSLLPTPEPREGIEFRWVRSAMAGRGDTVNVSAKFREGWEPVKRADYPEMKIIGDLDSRFPDNIEVGGLILCAAPTELMQQRRDYMQRRSDGQMEAVDRNFLRENDSRMPLHRPHRESRVSRFGED